MSKSRKAGQGWESSVKVLLAAKATCGKERAPAYVGCSWSMLLQEKLDLLLLHVMCTVMKAMDPYTIDLYRFPASDLRMHPCRERREAVYSWTSQPSAS